MAPTPFYRLVCGGACAMLFALAGWLSAAESQSPPPSDLTLDLRYSPPQWQTAICLPDDPCKSLVDQRGILLYHHHKYTKFGSDNGKYKDQFGTSVRLSVADDAEWIEQRLYSPRVPIVQTHRGTAELDIVEEAFAVTDVLPGDPSDGGQSGGNRETI